MAKTTKHATLSPSKADRWIACPGSALLELNYPDKFSKYAEEGTFAHRLGEKCLKMDKPAKFFLGTDILLENGHSLKVSEEMVEAVQVYVDHVNNLVATTPNAKLTIEQRVSAAWIHDGLSGTADAIVAQTLGQLHINDLKYGVGVVVEAEENAQMKIYGLGALGEFEGLDEYESVVLHIIQPRARGEAIKSWEIPVVDLRAWGDALKQSCKLAMKPGAPLNDGDWCQWCKHAANCPKLRESASVGAVEVFAPEVVTELPAVNELTPGMIAHILSKLPALNKFAAAIEERAMQTLLAGEEIPGYKLVESVTHRQWAVPDLAGFRLELELGEEVWTERKVKTPAQVEKIAKAKKIDISRHIIKPKGGPTIAPITDKRPALSVTTAEDVFEPVETDENMEMFT